MRFIPVSIALVRDTRAKDAAVIAEINRKLTGTGYVLQPLEPGQFVTRDDARAVIRTFAAAKGPDDIESMLNHDLEADPPRCLKSMGCLCWFHARGGAPDRPCDATEREPTAAERRPRRRHNHHAAGKSPRQLARAKARVARLQKRGRSR